MTKEELEKEIRNYIDKNCNQWETDGLTVDDIVRIAVSDFVEPREKQITELEAQMEKMKKYIKACWVEENLNDYSSYHTNTSDEFRDLVKELRDEVRNGR